MTQRVPLQTDLPLRSRRVQLNPPSTVQREPGESIMDAVIRREAIALNYDDDFIATAVEYSPWFSNRPQCSGFYQVKQRATGHREIKHPLRVWFDAPTHSWWFDGKPMVTHEQFMMSHFWRGLMNAANSYPYSLRSSHNRVVMLP